MASRSLNREDSFIHKNRIMNKFAILALAASFILSVIPKQIKAETDTETDTETTENIQMSSEKANRAYQLDEIKPIDSLTLLSSEFTEKLKVASPLASEQGKHNGRFNKRPPRRDVDIAIQGDRGCRHNHSGAYIGGGGVLILVLVLILIR